MAQIGTDNAGRLTTHVLDTARGCPAEGLLVELFRLGGGQKVLIASEKTNSDGRLDAPLLSGNSFETGVYELNFHAGAYLRRREPGSNEPLFLDEVPVRFGIADATRHYHVPLLISPYGFTTYRGS